MATAIHRGFCLAVLTAISSLPALGQLEVTGETKLRLNDASGMTKIGNTIFIDGSTSLSSSVVALITVETEAANVDIEVSDSARVPGEAIKIAAGRYVIDKPGRWWVSVVALDFAKNIYARKSVVVEVGSSPGPPSPTPPGPGPTPTPPSPISDTYGLGLIAFNAAPRDASGAAKYAEVYHQAGQFLFGIPSLKFITSVNDQHNNDPNRSVLAWIKQEQDKMVCTDPAICQQWAAWRVKIADAFRVSQTKRQFTRDDWFAAFEEVSKALRAVR